MFVCTRDTFRVQAHDAIRWLHRDSDYGLAAESWARRGSSLTREQWDEAILRYRYRYAGLLQKGIAVAIAAILPYSEDAWEVAAVGTDPAFRRQGFGKRVVSFVTAGILESGRVATCDTRDDNEAMIQTALGVGFVRTTHAQAEQYRQWFEHYFAQFPS